MGFNYGYEKKKFDSRWKRLEVEYCDAGMSEEQIAAMKEYDWAWFCSQRVFQNHTQPIPCEEHKLFGKGVLLNHSFSTKRCGSIANRFYRMLSGICPDRSRVFSFSHYTTPTKR